MTDLASLTVAVTGTGGFLGAVIARHLAARGAGVHAFARSAPALGPGVTGHAWDPTRTADRPAPGLVVDAVVDCAALLPSREADGGTLRQVNAALAAGALELAARGRGRLVYMSSQSVYGRPDIAVIDASTPPAPDNAYGEAKLAAEQALAAAVGDGRLAGGIALRLPAVVGAGAHGNFPALVAARVRAGETVTLFNPEGLYNAVVSAGSVAAFAARLAMAAHGFHAVSLASQPPIPVRAAAEAIAEGMDMPLSARVEAAPHRSPTIDPSAALSLGFAPERPDDVLRAFGRVSA
jgi:UDP-glucose 4-epimerase